jgi:hypothetical protein
MTINKNNVKYFHVCIVSSGRVMIIETNAALKLIGKYFQNK